MELEDEADVAVAEGGELTVAQPEDISASNIYLWRPALPPWGDLRGAERAENLQQRGFACATASHDANDLATLDGEVDAA